MESLPMAGPTYIDNGDGTCRTEYPRASWRSGPYTPPRVPTRRERIAAWWLDVRIWVCVHVLRVERID